MRKANSAVLLISFAALTLSSAPAFAHGRGRDHEDHGEHYRNHGRDHGRDHERDDGRDHGRDHRWNRHREYEREHYHRAYWRSGDRGMIDSYYRYHRSDLPPGLARREDLPPGLVRQLRRNGELPPGLRGRIIWVPRDLDRRLGPLPYGYRRCWVGDNLLVVNVRTFRIADVMLGFTLALH